MDDPLPGRPHNGFAANITVPARRLNGVVVRPGQVFDFWNALGEVSFRTGYRLGGAIVGGHSVEGKALAGGICAASTTLFNAAARGGLQIVSRAPHWYYITRYPVGLDATVSRVADMRFRNDTQAPDPDQRPRLAGDRPFEIWSVPNGRNVSWSRPTSRTSCAASTPCKRRLPCPAGGRSASSGRSTGRTSRSPGPSATRTAALIHRDTFVSHYHRMIGVMLVGK